MTSLFIDTPDEKSANNIYNKLKRLKTTLFISKPVHYQFGGIQQECIIMLDSSWNEEQLDSWLYRTKGIDYIGCGTKE